MPAEGIAVARLLREAGLVGSNAEGGRMIDQRAVRLDHERVADRGLALKAGATHLLQVGSRRYARVTLIAG